MFAHHGRPQTHSRITERGTTMKVTATGTPITGMTPVAAANGHAPAPAPTTRPYWQDRLCPDWCAVQDAHEDQDGPGDRHHFGPDGIVTLALEKPHLIRRAGNGDLLADPLVDPSQLNAYLQQEHRERAPRVCISRDEGVSVDLTLAEAGELAEILAGLVRQAAEPLVPAGGIR